MLDSNIVVRGEDLILPNPDPAVEIKTGYRRFLVGLDIAQSIDQNAFAIILDERVPFYDENGRQELMPRRREIVRAERVPQMSYTQLAIVTRNLMLDPSIAGRAYLAVDAGGPGRAFCDLLNTKSVQHTRIQIVGGDNEAESKERGATFNNVGKNRLLSSINSGMHVGELKIGNFPMRDELRNELESFDASITDAGRMKIEGGTAAGHADIAMAAAMAFWLSDHRSVGAVVGQTQLRGYW
ncbi:hypothetical protein BMG03_13760 [Thioclava nitratireducens]|uniref:Terminase large subunit gp17-like C-terminal domain-containing protein n=1 Tax=Thioclava nitratireducens TaxID=1915078 RepID=A0ABN4X9N6_9RHOB|nr:hypothetical protein [Thioclava nitratireducens]AQS48740.1 hypothetical protein BMG03_13760 [Thioclava nitratireducens]